MYMYCRPFDESTSNFEQNYSHCMLVEYTLSYLTVKSTLDPILLSSDLHKSVVALWGDHS